MNTRERICFKIEVVGALKTSTAHCSLNNLNAERIFACWYLCWRVLPTDVFLRFRLTRYMKYFRYDGTLYTAINPSDVDSLPGIPNSDPVYNLKGRELRHAIWVTERCPELAYMVRSYDSESAFLSRLQVDPRHVSIQRSGNDYFLSQDLRASWA